MLEIRLVANTKSEMEELKEILGGMFGLPSVDCEERCNPSYDSLAEAKKETPAAEAVDDQPAPKKRKRRTKAEMEAEKNESSPQEADQQEEPEPEPEAEPTKDSGPSPQELEVKLRAELIAAKDRVGMDAVLDLLKTFGDEVKRADMVPVERRAEAIKLASELGAL